MKCTVCVSLFVSVAKGNLIDVMRAGLDLVRAGQD